MNKKKVPNEVRVALTELNRAIIRSAPKKDLDILREAYYNLLKKHNLKHSDL